MSKKEKKFSILNTLLLLIDIVVSLLLLISVLAGNFKPSAYPYIAFIGLCFPYLLIAEILFLLIFISRKSKLLFVPVLFILISIPSISKILTLHKNDNIDDKNAIKIVSYNVKNLSNSNINKTNDSIFDKIFDYLHESKADVLMLQEFYYGDKNLDKVVSELKNLTGTEYHCYTKYYTNSSNAIITLSKYQIININSIRFSNNKSFAVYCDMIKGNDTIRLINTHLQSLHITKDEYSAIPQSGNEVRVKSARIYRKVTTAFQRREEQVKAIAPIISKSPYSIILCGDFNDTPNSYAYHTIHKYLDDAFSEAGNGFGFTFRELPLLRIDYMFSSKDVRSTFFKIDRLKGLSDHNVIIGKFKLHE
ncbi:MAG: endonuclease/exonuclease/phosphatase family protein [Bacteroidales bacterium]|jgi:endonuclease/exonuclease/phosphatase family metal-dependent hydrolase|nr:endonuclease/exonuclease/phosphatase family protein [Bacteroidales bacterium]MDD2204201.1 endonuclease/exonuclease/phosphatase family protein [Bacteroidales bacterium]MDD3152254.1 endonuclease/exonuclease/phosphatase family protein [Bacteroidales bacterium]MDD3913626.1 endonuclease/exonuclease/phosphatase family protein [Bacteroidales bacterium]MDD4634729.1 endonuclease/exonuclease/phosphatase family protein [Bacteroidales bacterium]